MEIGEKGEGDEKRESGYLVNKSEVVRSQCSWIRLQKWHRKEI